MNPAEGADADGAEAVPVIRNGPQIVYSYTQQSRSLSLTRCRTLPNGTDATPFQIACSPGGRAGYVCLLASKPSSSKASALLDFRNIEDCRARVADGLPTPPPRPTSLCDRSTELSVLGIRGRSLQRRTDGALATAPL